MEEYESKYIDNVIFGIFSFLLTVVFIKLGTIVLSGDGSFHFSRVEELYNNFRNRKLTFVASHTFSSTGVGTFLFYPSILLYPWVILRLIFSPVTSFYVWYGLMLFITMCVAYNSMWLFDKDRVRAIVFGILYTIFPYHIHLGIAHLVVGEFIAYTFIPLFFIGLYYCLVDRKKWYLLGIGWTLILYSHIVSAYITLLGAIAISIIYMIIDVKSIKRVMINLSKNIILVTLLSSFVLIPFVTDFIGASIKAPNGAIFGYVGSFQEILLSSITNTVDSNRSVGIFAIFTIIVGYYSIRKSKVEEKIAYGLGVFILLCTSTIFPWRLFNNTIVGRVLGAIQFPYRLNTYVGFFLMITFSLILSRLIHSISNRNAKILLISGVMIFLMVSYYGSLTDLFVKIHESQGNLLEKNTKLAKKIPNEAIIKNSNYHNIFDYSILYGEIDYYPSVAFNNLQEGNGNYITKEVNPKINSILSHRVIIGGKEKVKIPKVASNYIEYNVKVGEKEKIDIPVLAYKRTKVMLNGKNVGYTASSRGTVMVDGEKGNNKISVTYQPSKLLYVGIIVSFITWIGLLIGLIFSKRRNVN
ncbi:YfhO family protein [Ligilactobacillus salivarius]|uniref:YfhO family protein n=1 Tax=Ligilactobacillus salivarius TaxID=1624 RepID=UPI00209804AD|nr:YfhO family protein [Ligilactobacillus salivarius]MCO7135780.1 YfhO family protein [Ligilactobacillus salivarius]